MEFIHGAIHFIFLKMLCDGFCMKQHAQRPHFTKKKIVGLPADMVCIPVFNFSFLLFTPLHPIKSKSREITLFYNPTVV